eukprot:Anaeramoba_ignava/a479579_11.p2 GENE.a479579_11~~a479579_11.p2  ORF type:complete len:187 (+),score=70.22 a479579_11:56-562(+)
MEKIMENIFHNQETSDIKFIVGNEKEEIFAHKLILSISSSYWKNQFYPPNWDQQEQKKMIEIFIPDVPVQYFVTILKFLYSRKLDLGDETIEEILHLADRFKIPTLIEYCLDFLYHKTTFDNCFRNLRISQEYHSIKLHKEVCSFIQKFFGIIFSSSSFNSFSKRNCN